MQFPRGNCITRVVWCVYIYRRQPKKHEWCNSPRALHHACCLMCMYAESKKHKSCNSPRGIASPLLYDLGDNQRNTSDAIPQGELHHACCLMCMYVCRRKYQNNASDAIPQGDLHHACCLVCMYAEGNQKHEWGSMARRFGASWLFLEDFMRSHDFDGQRFSSLEQRFLRGKISAAKTATGCET